MGDLTRAEFRAEIIANLGNKTNLGSGTGLDSLNRALDRVHTRIERGNLAGWTELTRYDTDDVSISGIVATDAVYANLPSTLHQIKGLFVRMEGGISTTKVIQMLRGQWDTLVGDPIILPTASRILHYIDERNSTGTRQLRWWPVPNVDYTLHRFYNVHHNYGSGDLAQTLFEGKDDLIIAGATHYMFNRFQAFEEAEIWRKVFKTQMAEAAIEDQNKPDVQAIMRGITATNPVGAASSAWLDPFASGGGGGGGGRTK